MASRIAAFARRALSRTATAHNSDVKISRLNNGLLVATKYMPFQTGTVALCVNTGSRHENQANNGSAHFFEHLAFKGTKKRPQRSLEVTVEDRGALLNAFTSREHTVFFMKCLSRDTELAVDMLSDIVVNALLRPASVENERQVILEEMRHVADMPDEFVFDNLHALAFKNSPLGRTILGPQENIESISAMDLRSYITTHYTGPRTALVAVGSMDHDKVVELAAKALSALPSHGELPSNLPNPFHPGEDRHIDATLPLAHFALAVPGVSWAHPDYIPLTVAATVIGAIDRNVPAPQKLSSRLAQVTMANGLANRYFAFHTSYADTGLWGIFASCNPDTVADFLPEVQRELKYLAEGITAEDVEIARIQLRSALLIESDGTTQPCLELCRQLLAYGQPVSLADKIEAVDLETVKRVARDYIVNRDPAVACHGAAHNFPTYETVRKGMYL